MSSQNMQMCAMTAESVMVCKCMQIQLHKPAGHTESLRRSTHSHKPIMLFDDYFSLL